MPAASWEDLDDFLDPEEFGVQAVITLQAGGSFPLCVIFDAKAEQAGARDAFTFDTNVPRALCREDLVASVARGDSIAITFPAGVRAFDITAAPETDGTGFATLLLATP